eukprot:2100305-Alexandrium_andersonii.AAC.1
MALSAALNLQRFGDSRPLLVSRAPNFCRFRATERAVWSVGRVGTETSRTGCWSDRANFDRRA